MYSSQEDQSTPDQESPTPGWYHARSGARLTTQVPVQVYRHCPYSQCFLDAEAEAESSGDDDWAASAQNPQRLRQCPQATSWVALPTRERLPRELLAELVTSDYHYLTGGEAFSVASVTLLARVRNECESLLKEALPRHDEWTGFLNRLGFKTWHHDAEFCEGMVGIRPSDQRVSRFTREECEEGDRKREAILAEQCVVALKRFSESLSNPQLRSPYIFDTDRSGPRVSALCVKDFLKEPFSARIWTKALLRRLFGAHIDAYLSRRRSTTDAGLQLMVDDKAIEHTIDKMRYTASKRQAERARLAAAHKRAAAARGTAGDAVGVPSAKGEAVSARSSVPSHVAAADRSLSSSDSSDVAAPKRCRGRRKTKDSGR